ncbi:MAG: 50S ribosomal protein L13 [Candidatus Omnitrophica bacterium]|nr:50S ribosomal protein L13 [Candidatus Omnitrophota bacterium]
MQKTYIPAKTELKRKWYLFDAKGEILGRLATRIATILRGKHRPLFTPHMDTGDGVIVINASQIKVTREKLQNKFYRKHSGYPGGFKEINLKTLLKKNPSLVIRLAVKRMLPSGPLGRRMLKKLKIYKDDKHPHQSQKPILWGGKI